MCASNAAHDRVEPVAPPVGVPLGERVTFEGYSAEPLAEVNPKKKVLERLFPDLTTDAKGTPCYKGVPFMTSQGPCTSGIPGGSVA
jgi:aminoacyl tRNA synthase complex-interacting multifunctional protein 1